MSQSAQLDHHQRSRTRIARWGSLSICLMVLGAWFVATRWPLGRSFGSWRLESYGGVLVCYIWGDGPEVRSSDAIMVSSRGSLGLEWPSISGGRGAWTTVTIPYWLVVAPVVVMTGIAWFVTHRRPEAGRCHRCRYDLRGNQSGACPECGAPFRTPDEPAPAK